MKNSHRGNNQHNYLIDYIKAIGVIGVMLVHLYKPIPYLTCVITNFYIPVFLYVQALQLRKIALFHYGKRQ